MKILFKILLAIGIIIEIAVMAVYWFIFIDFLIFFNVLTAVD